MSNWVEWIPFINTAILTSGFLGLFIFVLIREKHWSAPSQHLRLTALERDSIRTHDRITRLEDNVARWGQDNFSATQAILRELEMLRGVKTKDIARIEQELQEVKDAVTKVDQELVTLPCYLMRVDGTPVEG